MGYDVEGSDDNDAVTHSPTAAELADTTVALCVLEPHLHIAGHISGAAERGKHAATAGCDWRLKIECASGACGGVHTVASGVKHPNSSGTPNHRLIR